MSTVQGGQGGIVTQGLVLNLNASNPRSYDYPYTSTTWTDLSGNNNTGTLLNSPTFNSTNGGSILFDGIDDNVITTTNLGTNPLPSHTISVWFRTSVASGKKIVGIEDKQSGQLSIYYDRHIYMGTNGRIYYGVYDTNYRLLVSTQTLNNNQWHNAVGVCTGTNQILLYINGILNSSGIGNSFPSYTTSYIRIGSYFIGGWTNALNGYFTGNISSIQVYNRALSQQEVLQNFNATRARFGV